MRTREDRRWPPPALARALRAKYPATRLSYPHAVYALTCEYYGRSLPLRYPIRVGRWRDVRPGATPTQWWDHGRVPAHSPATALAFALHGTRGIWVTVALTSPVNGDLLVMPLPLGEVTLPDVLDGPARPWIDWHADARYSWVARARAG